MPSSTITGSGTAGQVAFFNSSTTITSSSSLSWDGSILGVSGRVRVGDGAVGTPSLSFLNATSSGLFGAGSSSFSMAAGGILVGTFADTSIRLRGGDTAPIFIRRNVSDTTGFSIYVDGSDDTYFLNTSATSNLYLGTNSTPVFILTSSGATPATFRKDQNGKTAVSIFNASAGASASSELRLTNDTDDFRLTLDSSGSGNVANIIANSGLSGLNIATLGTDPITLKTSNTTAISINGTTQAVTIGTPATTTIQHSLNSLLSATAGAGGATLPATPEGFIVITINGTDRKIPYYPTA